jgi:protein TonB
MEEHKGDTDPTVPVAGARTESSPPQEQKPVASALSPPAREPVETRPDADRETDAPAVASTPARPAAPVQRASPETRPEPVQTAPVVTITLHGTDSPSDARAWGTRILPAAPDALFHNRPPEYPEAAARSGQRGTVVLLIHVAPSGRAAGVDVVASSGYALLDRAASDAVARWRFLPAVKDGQTVASDMTAGFIFDY